MSDSFCSISKCLTTHLSYLLVFVNGVPCTFVAKTKSNQSQGAGVDTFEGPTFLPYIQVPMGESVLEVESPILEPCHFLCSGLDNWMVWRLCFENKLSG